MFLFSFPVPASHSSLSIGSIGCTEPGSQTQQCRKEGQESMSVPLAGQTAGAHNSA